MTKELPYDPVILPLGIYPKEVKTFAQKNICSLVFMEALFSITRTWKELKYPSMSEWIKKLWCIYINIYTMECYSTIEN